MTNIQRCMLVALLLLASACSYRQPAQQPTTSSPEPTLTQEALASASALPRGRNHSQRCSTAASPTPQAQTVLVYFHCADHPPPAPPLPLAREITTSDASLAAAMQALLAGPTDAERAAGFHSWFSAATRDMLIAATIDDHGHALINFHNFYRHASNATTTTGSRMLLDQLNATVFQWQHVVRIEYQVEGDCARFWVPLQVGSCQQIERADWERSSSS